MVLAGCAAALMATGIARGAGEEESFGAAMELVSARASRYERAALGFSCEETVILGKFSSSTGENKREQKNRYDYLYEGSSETGYREIRMQPSKSGDPADAREVDPGLDVPGAYDWALLFSQQHRSHFRFEAAGSELVDFHATVIIAFRGGKTFDRGREIHEWSGRVWVDSETGNFVKVEAEPNGQEEMLSLKTAEWRKSMRIVGVPVKRQPRGFRYRLTFSVDKFGLSFPGEAETRRFALTLGGEEELKERIAQRFRNYVFFNVQSEEDFATSEPPAPAAAPPASGK
jgi:hypothetical protein